MANLDIRFFYGQPILVAKGIASVLHYKFGKLA
jgi:hypothetical protein